MSSENPKIAEIQRSVADSYRQITQLVDERLVKLSPEQLYQAPAENEWSVMQSLAHIVEIMPYWADEVAKLVKAPGQKFGRVLTDENRLRAIDEHGRDSLAEAQAALPGSYAHLQNVLAGLTDADLTRTGVHSRYGEKSLEWFIQEFITDHLKNHITQLDECLAVVS
jgi:uncharacterized damage-inducible protein DinB